MLLPLFSLLPVFGRMSEVQLSDGMRDIFVLHTLLTFLRPDFWVPITAVDNKFLVSLDVFVLANVVLCWSALCSLLATTLMLRYLPKWIQVSESFCVRTSDESKVSDGVFLEANDA